MFSGGPSVCACGARAGHSPTGLPSTSSFVSPSLGVAKCSTVTPRCVDCRPVICSGSASVFQTPRPSQGVEGNMSADCRYYAREEEAGGAISEYL